MDTFGAIVLGPTGVMREATAPLFDASIEGFKNVPVWIKMSNISLEYWFDARFRAIGDTLGTFIVVDSSYKSSPSWVVAQILMEIDPSEGLFEYIKLWTYAHILDYINVPFHCVRCHNVDHVLADCDKGSLKKSLMPLRADSMQKGMFGWMYASVGNGGLIAGPLSPRFTSEAGHFCTWCDGFNGERHSGPPGSVEGWR